MSSMRLLLDENLSEAVIARLSLDFPGSVHVRGELDTGASDQLVWDYARANGLVLVTRDEDFQRMSVLHGAPPKVIWLAGHNLTNTQVVETLSSAKPTIETFVADTQLALIELR